MERTIDETIRDSGHLPPAGIDIDSRIGSRVRLTREASGESLRAFASRCGVSASMLSDVERGTKSPTIAILSAIAEGLGIPLSRLVDDQHPLDAGPQILRSSEITCVIDPETGVERSHLGPLITDSNVEFVRFRLPHGASTGGFTAHAPGTVERLYVAAGEIELTVAGKATRLNPGDTVLYRATVLHAFRSVGTVDAEVFLVVERA